MEVLNAQSYWDMSKNQNSAIFPDGALCRLAPDAKCFANATRHRTLRHARPNPMDDVHTWKALIQAGYPVVFALNLYSNLYDTAKDKSGGYMPQLPGPNDRYRTGHVIMAVGWDDGKGAIRVQNSWGANWAGDGFFWMKYEWLKDRMVNQNDTWIMVDSQDTWSSTKRFLRQIEGPAVCSRQFMAGRQTTPVGPAKPHCLGTCLMCQ